MKDDERLVIMWKWYCKPAVKFEIINFTKLRESSVLSPSCMDKKFKMYNTRMLKIHSVQHFDFWLQALHIFDNQKILNFYSTMAYYEKGIPNQDANLSKRTKEDREFWRKNHHKEMLGYDFLIDIDADNKSELDYAYDTAKMVKQCFDNFKVPYELRFSGRGFHFIIPFFYTMQHSQQLDPNKENSIYMLLARIIEALRDKFSEMIDSSLHDSRRLSKIPYSLAHYEDGIYVCWPILTDEEFNSFTIDKYNISNMLDVDIKGRGTRVFNKSGNLHSLLHFLRVR